MPVEGRRRQRERPISNLIWFVNKDVNERTISLCVCECVCVCGSRDPIPWFWLRKSYVSPSSYVIEQIYSHMLYIHWSIVCFLVRFMSNSNGKHFQVKPKTWKLNNNNNNSNRKKT